MQLFHTIDLLNNPTLIFNSSLSFSDIVSTTHRNLLAKTVEQFTLTIDLQLLQAYGSFEQVQNIDLFPIDIDVIPMDNLRSDKQGVSRLASSEKNNLIQIGKFIFLHF